MISFLFWNINKQKPFEALREICFENEIDLVLLAEVPDGAISEILLALNEKEVVYDFHANIGCQAIHIFSKFQPQFIQPIEENARMTIRELQLPGRPGLLLGACHLISKLYFDPQDQALEASIYKSLIDAAEKKVGHNRTIIVGDFNLNPFEPAMISATGFNATASKAIATKVSRTVQGKKYDYFYNPMWNLFGDEQSPPGSYYKRSSRHTAHDWNILDQLIIRPVLLDYFSVSDLRILVGFEGQTLMTKTGIPDKKNFSDHLPISFRLNI